MMKKLVILGGALVVVLVAAVAILGMSIDAIAKTAIERGSTYALGVQTTLGSASIGLFSGEFGLQELDVANPDGFESAHFLALGDGFLAVSLGSLRKDTVEVPTLALTGVDVNLEKRDGKANYKVITDNLKRFESDDPGDGTSEPETAEGKKFLVREIVIRDINVKVDLVPDGGALTRMEVPIDEIRLTEVGNEGLTTGELANLVIKAVLAAVVKNGADLPADLVNDLGGALAGLESIGDMSVSEAAGAVTGIIDAADKGDVGKAIEGLGGLLGGEKK